MSERTVTPAHYVSKAGKNPVVDMFQLPATDVSFQRYRLSTYDKIGTGITPIEFNIPKMQECTDLSRSFFTMILRLHKTDKTPYKTTDKFQVVNNLAHSIIKQFVVRLNGTLLSPQTDTYPYKAYFETLINHDREDGETLLRPQGWTNALDVAEYWEPKSSSDDDIKSGTMTDSESKSKDLLVLESSKYMSEDNTAEEVHLRFRPNLEVFHLPSLLVPNVQMKFQVYLHDPKFFTVGTAKTDKKLLRLKEGDIDIKFHLCRVKLSPHEYLNISRKISNGAWARYPTVRSEIKTFTFQADTLQ